jgi:LCP family protein required for cell wall assembly
MPDPVAEPDAPEPAAAKPAAEPSAAVTAVKQPFRTRHTTAQKFVLATNLLVVIACFVAAGALLVGKNIRENFQAVSRADIVTTSAPPVTSAAIAPIPSDSIDPGDSTPITEPPVTAPPETFPAVDTQAINFLIAGDDSNACVDPNSPWAGAADPGRANLGERSDTIMVLRLDPVTKVAAALSFPRDLYVKIHGRGKSRINSAYRKNDYQILAQTIYDNFGVEIDHYIQVDFCAFKTIVDAVGGVSVPFDYPIRDRVVRKGVESNPTGTNIAEAGCHTFGGDEALAYVRARHLEYFKDGEWIDDPYSDLSRIARQQDFLRRTLQAARAKGLDVALARGILKTVSDYVVFDADLQTDQILQFVGVVRDIDPSSIRTYQIAGKGTTLSDGAQVLIPNINANMRAILDVFQGKAPLAGAPVQVFETPVDTTIAPITATTAAVTTTTVRRSSTATTVRPTTTTVRPTTTTSTTTTTTLAPTITVEGPAEREFEGGIVPNRNVSC